MSQSIGGGNRSSDYIPKFSDQTAEIVRWKDRAWDLIAQNDLLRLSVDILRAELAEEKSKHGSV